MPAYLPDKAREVTMYKQSKNTPLIFFGLVALLSGCAPGPPLPPIFPGFDWLIMAFVIVVFSGVFGWRKFSSEKPVKTDYLAEALNAINQKLIELEKKIDILEKKQDQEKDR